MRKVLWMTLLAVFLIQLQGCTPRSKFLIVNNTGASLTLITPTWRQDKDDQKKVEHLNREDNHQLIDDQSSVWVDPDRNGQMFDFSQDGIEYRYGNNFYITPWGYGTRVGSRFNLFAPAGFVVQVEPSGLIYVLEHDQDIPAQSFPEQPEDYPLVPVKTAVSRGGAGANISCTR